MADISSAVASWLAIEPAKDLYVIAKRHARYFFCFKSIAKDLGAKKEELRGKFEGFSRLAKDDENNNKMISRQVDKWLKEAEEHIGEADNLEEETKQKRKCFLGWCPNCSWRYRLGNKMAKKIGKIEHHHAKTEFVYFSRLPTLTGQGDNDFMYFDSRKVAYDRLLEALRDSTKFRIGLYGMGGLGKTSLVKEVRKEVMKDNAFNRVAFVAVSNSPDVKKIQEEIAEFLGLKFEENSEAIRKERLYTRLTNGEKILLILDDVWDNNLDFEAIGIPFDNSQKGYCRVLLTTRREDVCRSLDCQLHIGLSMLSEEDSWNLFKKYAGIIEERTPTRLRVVAQKIAEQCKGVPVAIATVAGTLKIHTREVWEQVLKTLKHSKRLSNNILDRDERIYRCLKLSYDNLMDEKAKKLFLLCSLFPEDYDIPTEDLIRYGIGLGIFEDDDCYGLLRTQVHMVKEMLINCCMLINASVGRESVKMHDLVRDVAHSIANKEIQVVMELKKSLAVLQDISSKGNVKYLWLNVDSTEFNVLYPLAWPELKILIMNVNVDEEPGFNTELDLTDVSDIFFKEMKSLQVLNLAFGHIGRFLPLRPFRKPRMRIPELIDLQTLRLEYWDLGDISVIGSLKRLKTLELEQCRIMEFPDGILGLKKLRLLGLFRCLVEKNPYGVIGRLSQLEELYFTKNSNFNYDWKVDGESISEFFDEKCCFRELERYHIEIGGGCMSHALVEGNEKSYLKHKILYIERLDASTSNAAVKDLVQKAEILHLDDVQGDYKSITPDIDLSVGGLNNELIGLQLDSCSEIQYLLDTTNHSSERGTIFSNLVELRLQTMRSLEKLCHGPSPSDFLQKLGKLYLCWCEQLQNILFVGNLNLRNLKSVEVSYCPALTSLFTLSIALSLELLEELTIENCNGLKYIIADEREREDEDSIVQEKDESDQKIGDGSMFPKLNRITIDECNSLEWIFPLSFAGGLEQLEEMTIEGAGELKTIFGEYQHEGHPMHVNPKEIILPSLREAYFRGVPNFISILPVFYQPSDQPLESINLESTALTESENLTCENPERVLFVATAQCQLSHLRRVTLYSIEKLVLLFKLSTAREMLLEYLRIDDCHELKHIIVNEQEDHDDDNYNAVTVFPKLRSLVVTKCSLLEMVLPASMAHGLLQLEYIHLRKCPQLEYLFGHNDCLSRQIESEHHIEFPALKSLVLGELPKMMSICSKNYKPTWPTWPTLESLELSTCPSSIVDCIRKKGLRENVIEGNQSRNEAPALEIMLNLESFTIEDNEELEGIFVLEDLPSSRQQTQLSSKLEELSLKTVPKLRHICKTAVLLSFQNLRLLTVHGCGKLSYVFSACVLRNFPELEKLIIRDCDELEQIIEDHEDHKVCFPALESIEIERCNKLKFLFCSSNELPMLKKLSIKEASQLEEVFRQNICNVEDKLMLPSLEKIEIERCNKLKSLFCSSHELLRLKKLSIKEASQLEEIFRQNICNVEDKLMLPYLEIIEIERCNKLKSLFCSSDELPMLEKLSIKEASQLEEVFRHNICNVEDKLMLPSLFELELKELPNLVSICPGLELQSVPILTVKDCPKLPSASIPHEYQNSEEKGNEAEDIQREKIEGELQVAGKDKIATGLNKGKQPAGTVLSSSEIKDPQTSTSAGMGITEGNDSDFPEDKEDKEAKTAGEAKRAVQTIIPMTDENAGKGEIDIEMAQTVIHQEKVEGSSALTNANEGRDSTSQTTIENHLGKGEEKGEVDIEMAPTGIHQDKVEEPSTMTNSNEGRDTAPQTTIKNHSVGGEVRTEGAQSAIHQDKVKDRSSGLTNPKAEKVIAPQMTTKIHSDDECQEAKKQEKKEKIKVHTAVAKTAPPESEEADDAIYQGNEIVEDHLEKEGKEAKTEKNEDTAPQMTIKSHSEEKEGKEAKTEEREDTARQMTTKDHSDAVAALLPEPSSQTLLSSASLIPPIHTLSSQVCPSWEEDANFRDIGKIKKKYIPLIEKAIAKYPSLWAWRDHQKHQMIIQFGYNFLGEMLEFLASTRWRDLNKNKKAEFDTLIDGLETTFAFDIQWLEKTRAMINQDRFDEETIDRVQTLEVKMMEQQIKVDNLLSHVQIAKEKLNKTKSELNAIRGGVENFNDFIGF